MNGSEGPELWEAVEEVVVEEPLCRVQGVRYLP